MKKLFISSLLISILLIFPGCFGGGDEPTPDTTTTAPPTERIAFYRPIEADDFTLQIPEDWETIQHFPSSYPENTAVAFINNNKDKDFIANINIVRNKVAEGTSSSDYALTMFQTISEQLVNFKKVTQTETQLPTGDTVTPSYLFEFEGTNNPTDRTRGFIQTFGVKGTTAYIVTGTYALSDDELAIDQIKQSVPSFRLK
jgi:hypothetical protein